MTVREAKFVDTPQIACLMAEAHQRSKYAAYPFDLLEAKRFVAQSMQRHGHQNCYGCYFLVSEVDDTAEGFIIGFIDQVYPAVQAFHVTDILFIMSERADPRDTPEMLEQVRAWAKANPKVIEVHLGITNAIGDWQRVAKLYERQGGLQAGAMYEWRFER